MPPRRGRRVGARTIDLAQIRDALRSGVDVEVYLGIVETPADQTSHFEIVDDGGKDVHVFVTLMPDGQPVVARLAGAALGAGIWRVPKEGAEVVVLLPSGDMGADPWIVAVLSSGEVDEDVDGSTLLVVDSDRVRIKSTGGDVEILAPANGKKVLLQGGGRGIARKDDTVDIGSWQVTVSSGAITAINVTPPGGGAPVTIPTGTPVALSAKISSASDVSETG